MSGSDVSKSVRVAGEEERNDCEGERTKAAAEAAAAAAAAGGGGVGVEASGEEDRGKSVKTEE